LAAREKALGPDHPHVAVSLTDLASLYQARGCYTDPEPLYRRARSIVEKPLGPDRPDIATSLIYLAGLYKSRGRYADAEPLYKQAR
jgi:tetratricopeptide (TPR) repeat protein